MPWLVFSEENFSTGHFMEEQVEAQKIKIYPNPCKGNKVTIEMDSSEIKSIKISNILGKEIQKENLPIPQNKYELLLNNLPEGIYVVHIINTENKMYVTKLLISR